MKKRKELNALIGLGDSKRKKPKKGSGHRLLRTEPPGSESESSSEEDEFSPSSSGAKFAKRSYAQCCSLCYPLFLFIILAACVMACAGLIWMQIALKEDLDSLKEKLRTMESSQKVSSHEIPKLSEDLKIEQKKLDDMESGDEGLKKLWSNLTEINGKITLLEAAVNHLKANLKSASDLINLPTTVEELQKSVATIGSTLTSVQHDVKTIQAALEIQKKDDTDLMKKTTDMANWKKAVNDVNKTEGLHHAWTEEQINSILSAVANLSGRVSSLQHSRTVQHTDQEATAEPQLSPMTHEIKDTGSANVTARGDTQSQTSIPVTDTGTSRRPRFLSSKRSKRNVGMNCPKNVKLSGVTSLKDLEDMFQRSGMGPQSPGMSPEAVHDAFGTPVRRLRALECYDVNGDRRYSLMELKEAAGL